MTIKDYELIADAFKKARMDIEKQPEISEKIRQTMYLAIVIVEHNLIHQLYTDNSGFSSKKWYEASFPTNYS